LHVIGDNKSRGEQVFSQYDLNPGENFEEGVCQYDGTEMVLYWCDAVSEVAFVVPSLRQQSTNESYIGESLNSF